MSKKKKKPWPVFIAIVLAIFVGNWVGTETTIFGVTYYSIFEVIGNLFIRSLTLVVVPLVSSSIITGIARIAGDKSFGRLGAKTFGFYFISTFLAILIGIFFVNIISPGSHYNLTTATPIALAENLTTKAGRLVQILYDIIPANIVDVFSGKMLGLIFFSILFGYVISKIEKGSASVMMNFWKGLFDAMLQFTHLILFFLPLGVFSLVAKVFASTGFESLKSVSYFFITVICGLATLTFIGLPLLLKLIGKVSPIDHFKAMGPAIITAFSTSSSAAALPVTMECVEKRAGVSNRIASLVIPLGASINFSGSALYECVAAIFVAQAYGIDLSITSQLLVIVLALVTSLGVAGIPSGSLVGIIIILKALGLPAEGIGLFLAVDRLLDMMRTTVNIFSDSVCAVLVASTEGEKNLLAHPDTEI